MEGFEQPITRKLIGGQLKGQKQDQHFDSCGKAKQAVEELPAKTEFPVQITLESGESIEVLREHVKREQEIETVSGEWLYHMSSSCLRN